jgi:flagellar biosynthesis anti-sigma factor FlgM
MANTIDPTALLPIAPVDGKQPQAAALEAGQVQAPQAQSGQSEPEPATAADQARLSVLGGTLSAVTLKAAGLSGFRPEAVARLKAQIAAGNYAVDMQGLAQIVSGVLAGSK